MRKSEKNSIIEICPIRNVVARFGNKWAFLVILILNENSTVRFSEFRKLIPDISSRVLSETLRVLEADGLILRKAFYEIPPRVEYRLSALGSSLVPLIEQLTAWAKTNMKKIQKHRSLAKK